MTDLPRLIVAAPMSGSGKTTIVAGLIGALVARGLRVAPFKVGPDYIDPSYHSLAAGRSCHNLDAWMLPPHLIRSMLVRHTHDADIAIIEGVMGLFDGYSGRDDTGSTAHIARLTNTTVLVVLDARAMARTAAALIKGLRDFDPRVRVVGVILNRVGSPKHVQMLTDAIESSVGVPVIGYLERDETLHLPERHLGLVPTTEPGRWQEWIAHVGELVAATVDLDRVMELARDAGTFAAIAIKPLLRQDNTPPPVIAVARDDAFSFHYENNLDLLREAGAELAFFSPLHDHALPQGTRALYLCGGFPELHAAELAANTEMHTAIRTAAVANMPIYAECGGLMYLTEALRDQQGATFPMVGVLPGQSVMTRRLTLGYRTLQIHGNNWLWRDGETIHGHEFHYSVWETDTSIKPVYTILPDEWCTEQHSEGAQLGNVIASYIHLHFLAYPVLAERFVSAAAAWIGGDAR